MSNIKYTGKWCNVHSLYGAIFLVIGVTAAVIEITIII